MSLNSAMTAGTSGLQSESSALAAISNDIANVNTVGYKSDQVDFEALVGGQTGGDFSAGGVTTTTQQLVSQQGAMTQTSSPTDLAITGQGMFIVNTQPAAVSSANSQAEFTRAGSFTPDSGGFLKNTAGLYLLGWPADAQGQINTSSTAITSLEPINVTQIAGQVAPTTFANVDANVDASQAVSAQAQAAAAVPPGAGAYNAVTNSMTAYDPTAGTGVQPDFTIQVPVSDSLGGSRTLQLDLLKSATANQWYAEIQAVPPSDVVSGAGLAAGQIASGILAFNPDGSINMAATTLFGTPPNPNLAIGASSAAAPGAGQVNWASSLGIAAQTIAFGVGGTTGGGDITQFASSSAVQSIDTNGTPFGSVSAITISPDGIVTATFGNGTSRQIAQVAMATFSNPDGMAAVSGQAYLATQASGSPSVKAAGTGGAGTLTSSALESSTVDLSTEFTNLIIAQQAYDASSKVISTADQMTQALLQVIQG
ncbi:MAG TPA: flagellar hook-basal body complex protein [Caulobacteraceae bacterium]|nr:flagellar hook-basal body complex protein [Caulobacteraceae bacterium]